MTHSYRRATALFAAAALVLTTVTMPAYAADPTGTVTLASGNGISVPRPIAVTADDVVYLDGTDLYDAPTAGGTPALVSSAVGSATAAGPMVFYTSQGGRFWRDVATGEHGSRQNSWLAPAPHGWVYLGRKAGTTHIYLQDAATSAVTDLGVTRSPGNDGPQVLTDPTGVAVVQTVLATQYIDYVAYAHPGTVHRIAIPATPNGIDCSALTSNAIGCEEYAGDAVQDRIVRLPLSGGAPVVSVSETHYALDIAVTPTETGWLDYAGTFRTTTASGSSPLSIAGAGAVDGALIAAGPSFYFAYGDADDTGIYSAPAADQDPVAVVLSATPTALQAGSLALGPGRVVWRDNSSTQQPLWSRSLTTDASPLTAGVPQLIATHAPYVGVSASGARTAYRSLAGSQVISGSSVVELPARDGDRLQLSGTRVLYVGRTAAANHPYELYDLVDRSTINLTTLLHTTYGEEGRLAALWGDYVAYSPGDGSVWRWLIGADGPTRLAAPPAGSAHVTGVFTFGDHVAWNVRAADGTVTTITRNARTLSAARTFSGDAVGASVGGVELTDDDGQFYFQPWAGGAAIRLPDSGVDDVDDGQEQAAISGSTMAWVDPLSGQPKAAPLPVHVADQSRVLGNPFFDLSLPAGGTWHIDVPTSAPLTSCAVSVRDARLTVIRTLACDPAAAAVGDIVAQWDGKDGTGHDVATGTYTADEVASNGDGPLLSADGTSTAVGGSPIAVHSGSGNVRGTATCNADGSRAVTVTAAGLTAPSGNDSRGFAHGRVGLYDYRGDALDVYGDTDTGGNVTLRLHYTVPGSKVYLTIKGDHGLAVPTLVRLPRCADTTAPKVVMTSPDHTAMLTLPKLSWSGSDTTSGVANYDVRYRRAASDGASGTYTYRAALQKLTATHVTAPTPTHGYTYCYSVRARDRAGNVSAWSAERCTSAPFDDRSLSASAHWTRVTSTLDWNGTRTATQTLGATLTRAHVHADRLWLVATHCAACGTVGVYVGTTRIGTANLAAGTTTHRAVVALPRFSLRTGTVTIKVLTSGRTVQIDGLATSPR